jgi:hypothetical protein
MLTYTMSARQSTQHTSRQKKGRPMANKRPTLWQPQYEMRALESLSPRTLLLGRWESRT